MLILTVRYLLAAAFIAAGVVHLVNPRLFLPIMPPWIPLHFPCIIVSGICEIAGGLGLLAPDEAVRRWAGWGLIALLMAVFPANIYMAAAHVKIHGFPKHNWQAWARLPLQPLLMAGVAWTAKLLN